MVRNAEMYRRSGLIISREQGLRCDAGFVVPVLRRVCGALLVHNCNFVACWSLAVSMRVTDDAGQVQVRASRNVCLIHSRRARHLRQHILAAHQRVHCSTRNRRVARPWRVLTARNYQLIRLH